ncbi:MAG: hypothetical protein QM733_00065 [Ilumatobacteraceae bacterium]
MKRRTVSRSLVLLAAASVAVAACGSDKDSASTTTAAATTTAGATATTVGATATTAGATESTTGGTGSTSGAIDLASVCPADIVVQTDWFPEAEHGALYELVGDGYKIDTDKKLLRGPLVVDGQSTGVDIEIRTGGPSIGDQTVASQAYTDESITLAYANNESQVLQNAKTPLLSVVAPLERNPQIIYWDPATYPDVKTLKDLGDKNITINVFSGGVFSDVFVAEGIWHADQIDPSYNGAPDRFISEGNIAQQGFASAEPYLYQHEFTEWGKPIAYQLLDDAGFKVYSQTLAIRPDDKEKLAPCLKKLVPIFQQSAIDFVNSPDRAIAIILDAVKQYDTFWTYSQGVADFSVEQQKALGLVGNGPDSTLGNMDEDRIQGVIDQMRSAKLDFSADLKASDLFTNEFIDPSIGLK